jgi:transketolase|tara:strand:+ start:1509 stop:2405 length:897 start_codon:yes stop_codon:yes gene_type:complete
VGEKNPKVFMVSGDLGDSSGLSRFKNTYPDRFINVGIAEQNMIGVAAGLAKEGYNVFATSFAPFITLRSGEQIRMNLGYMELNVKAVAIGSGLSMAFLGNSHYGLEDMAIMRSIPNLTIVSPADCAEIVKVVHAAANFKGPMFIRLTGAVGNPPVYTEEYNFEIGKSITLKEGSDITIFSIGSMVYESLEAAKILDKTGISAKVVNMHTLKPCDYDAIDLAISSSKAIITVEEHTIMGGLGSVIAEYKAKFTNSPAQLIIGLPDRFGKTAEYRFLLEKYRLVGEKIAEDIQNFLQTKL